MINVRSIASGMNSIPLAGMEVVANVCGLLLQAVMCQRYINNESHPIESIYTFSLPVDAVLLDLVVNIDGRSLRGVVISRDQACEGYERGLEQGHGTALLENPREGLYTMSLGNMRPGASAEVSITFAQLLRWNGNTIRLSLPTTLAPWYGAPEQSGMEPHQIPVVDPLCENHCTLEVGIEGALRSARIECPSHAVEIKEADDRLILRARMTVMDRDFVLSIIGNEEVAASAFQALDIDGQVVLASFNPFFPGRDPDGGRVMKIVIDCACSMNGDSIGQARKALEAILALMPPGTWFNITCFGNAQEHLFDSLVRLSSWTRDLALAGISGLSADMGKAELDLALDAAYALVVADETGPADVLLVTDGGIWASDQLLDRAEASGHRIFTVGVGSTANEAVIRGLAEVTGGAWEFVSPREDVAGGIRRHFQRIFQPQARKIRITWPGIASARIPAELKAVFSEDTLHVAARFAEPVIGNVVLEVELEDGSIIRQDAAVVDFVEKSAHVPGVLACTVAALSMRQAPDQQKAAETAVRYGLMSPHTNLLVVDTGHEEARTTGIPTLHRVPHTLAAGWGGMGSVLELSPSLPAHAERSLSAPDHDIPAFMRRKSMPKRRVSKWSGKESAFDRDAMFALAMSCLKNPSASSLPELETEVHLSPKHLGRERVALLLGLDVFSIDVLVSSGFPGCIVRRLLEILVMTGESETSLLAAFLLEMDTLDNFRDGLPQHLRSLANDVLKVMPLAPCASIRVVQTGQWFNKFWDLLREEVVVALENIESQVSEFIQCQAG